jgi:hypothetical protein
VDRRKRQGVFVWFRSRADVRAWHARHQPASGAALVHLQNRLWDADGKSIPDNRRIGP